ncbi:MAG: type I phosphomannose isomerase catalytic subunit [Gammaproteobacteria bacterium]
MGSDLDIAGALARADPGVITQLRGGPLVPRNDNLVPRPWGGDLLSKFKGLSAISGSPVGECFEISAWPGDPEAHRFPSVIQFADGSEMPLPSLLTAAGAEIFGEQFTANFPLLPKLLDIKELLSIQGHPEGNTEVYVIVQADPGATLRLGFRQDMDPEGLAERLKRGRALQHALLDAVGVDLSPAQVQPLIAPWLAQRDGTFASVPDALRRPSLEAPLGELHDTYWWILNSMNTIPAMPGQVILNANPERVLQPGRNPSAEVHALGNPERAEFLALEIRKPGPTFRAWDNVRFPIREVDVDAAIDALSLKATTEADFLIEKRPLLNHAGLSRSVDCDDFCIDHIDVDRAATVRVPNEAVHCLHVLSGSVQWIGSEQSRHLRQGESAIVPVLAGAYELMGESAAQVVKVTPKLPV